MVEVILLFSDTDDPAALDDFLGQLVSSLRRARGLQSVRVPTGTVMSRGSRPPYARVVEATFDSLADWMEAIPKQDRREERDAFDRFAPLVLFFEVAAAP